MRTLLSVSVLALLACLTPAAAPPAPPRPSADALGDELPAGALARLGTGRFRLGAVVGGSLALSPDGKTIAAAKYHGGQYSLALLDSATGREIRALPLRTPGGLIEFTRDGKEIVSSGYDGAVRFNDVAQGRALREVKVSAGRAEVFAVSGDGVILASTERAYGRKVPLLVYDTKANKQLASLEPLHSGQIGLAMSPDGKWLAAYGSAYLAGGKQEEALKIAQTVQVWATATGKESKALEIGQGNTASGVAFSPDGKVMAIATTFSEVQLWDLPGEKRLKSWRGPLRQGVMAALTFSPDGKHLILTGRQNEASPAIWEVATGKRVKLARQPDCQFHSLSFDNGRFVALGLQGQAIVVWDLVSGRTTGGVDGHTGAVHGLAFRDGRLLTAAADRRVLEWEVTGRRVGALPEARGADRFRSTYTRADATSFSADAAYLLSAENYGSAVLRDVRSGEEMFSLPRTGGEAMAPSFSPDGSLVLVGGHDYTTRRSTVRVVRTESGEEVLSFDAGAAMPNGAAIDPTNKRMAMLLAPQAGGFNTPGSLLMWRIDENKEDTTFKKIDLPGAGYRIQSPLVFSPDGSVLAAVTRGGPSQLIHLFDAATGQAKDKLDAGGTVTLAPVFSRDGRSLVVATLGMRGDGGLVAMWELRTGKKRWSATLPAQATAVALDSAGGLLATGHADTTGLVWDVAGRYQTGKSRPDYDGLWKSLGSEDATKAFEALRGMTAGRDDAVAVLREQVKAAAGKSLGETELVKLVAELDDEDFETRQKAEAALEGQGKAAEALLRKALAGNPSAQLKRTVNALLVKISRAGVPPEQLATLRAVEALEWIGTAEARRLVEELARGRAGAALTQEAKATLGRMAKQELDLARHNLAETTHAPAAHRDDLHGRPGRGAAGAANAARR